MRRMPCASEIVHGVELGAGARSTGTARALGGQWARRNMTMRGNAWDQEVTGVWDAEALVSVSVFSVFSSLTD